LHNKFAFVLIAHKLAAYMTTCVRSYYVRRRRVLWFQVPNHAKIFYVPDLHGAVGTPFN